MAKTERIDEPTPNGGVYAIANFQDSDGSPAEKNNAKRVEIVEYDGNDKVVWRTYGVMETA